MRRSSSTAERGPEPVSGGGFPPGVLTSAGRPGGDRHLVAEAPDCTAEGEAPASGDLRLVLVTASGFEVPLVTSPAQAARLVRRSGETDVVELRGAEDSESLRDRWVCSPRPVPADRLLSRSLLVSRRESPVEGGAA
jgi:hypothetical protein